MSVEKVTIVEITITSMRFSASVKAEESLEISCNMVVLSSSLSLKLATSRASFSRS